MIRVPCVVIVHSGSGNSRTANRRAAQRDIKQFAIRAGMDAARPLSDRDRRDDSVLLSINEGDIAGLFVARTNQIPVPGLSGHQAKYEQAHNERSAPPACAVLCPMNKRSFSARKRHRPRISATRIDLNNKRLDIPLTYLALLWQDSCHFLSIRGSPSPLIRVN